MKIIEVVVNVQVHPDAIVVRRVIRLFGRWDILPAETTKDMREGVGKKCSALYYWW